MTASDRPIPTGPNASRTLYRACVALLALLAAALTMLMSTVPPVSAAADRDIELLAWIDSYDRFDMAGVDLPGEPPGWSGLASEPFGAPSDSPGSDVASAAGDAASSSLPGLCRDRALFSIPRSDVLGCELPQPVAEFPEQQPAAVGPMARAAGWLRALPPAGTPDPSGVVTAPLLRPPLA